MRIRLHGTRDEIAATLDQLRAVLDVQDVSRIYADRNPSRPALPDGRQT